MKLPVAARNKAMLAAPCFLVMLASATSPLLADLYQNQQPAGSALATSQAVPLSISGGSLPHIQ